MRYLLIASMLVGGCQAISPEETTETVEETESPETRAIGVPTGPADPSGTTPPSPPTISSMIFSSSVDDSINSFGLKASDTLSQTLTVSQQLTSLLDVLYQYPAAEIVSQEFIDDTNDAVSDIVQNLGTIDAALVVLRDQINKAAGPTYAARPTNRTPSAIATAVAQARQAAITAIDGGALTENADANAILDQSALLIRARVYMAVEANISPTLTALDTLAQKLTGVQEIGSSAIRVSLFQARNSVATLREHVIQMALHTKPCSPAPLVAAAWYPLDEQSGTSAVDLGSGRTGTYQGTPVPVASAVMAGGLTFNASHSPTDAVVAASSTYSNVGSGDFSITAWVKSTNSAGTIFYKRILTTDSKLAKGYLFMINGGRPLLQMADDTSGWFNYAAPSTTPNLADGQMHMVSVSVTRNQATGGKMYVDGNLIYTFNPTGRMGNLDSTGSVMLGSGPANTSLQGTLDEVMLYQRALTATEITSLYQAKDTGLCK